MVLKSLDFKLMIAVLRWLCGRASVNGAGGPGFEIYSWLFFCHKFFASKLQVFSEKYFPLKFVKKIPEISQNSKKSLKIYFLWLPKTL